jgi:hypothetical protein
MKITRDRWASTKFTITDGRASADKRWNNNNNNNESESENNGDYDGDITSEIRHTSADGSGIGSGSHVSPTPIFCIQN